jgi:hypothetical protein
MDGFNRCASLIRTDTPASVEAIASSAFSGCASFLELRMSSGKRIRAMGRSRGLRAFAGYEDDNDMRLRRRQLHLSTVGLKVSETRSQVARYCPGISMPRRMTPGQIISLTTSDIIDSWSKGRTMGPFAAKCRKCILSRGRLADSARMKASHRVTVSSVSETQIYQ